MAPKAIKISSAEEFTGLIEGLANDIVNANIHFRLYKALQESRQEYSRELMQSRTFWELTFGAHLDATLIRLCRAYDSQTEALNLATWLETIAANSRIFEEPEFRKRLKGNPFVDSLAKDNRKPSSQQLKKDRQLTSTSDPLVKRLIRWRHNVGAHRNPKETLVPGSTAGNPLEPEEIEELLDRAKRILNDYSQLFQAVTYSGDMVGADDFEMILKVVRCKLTETGRRIQEELDNHGDRTP